ncbi:head-tail connector protein [Aquibium microcysteis]|uniref:head-tail connector protein n=1 Tax=Aquibium microcysteis TaxID=675281 RepID=UPI00165D0473|nr:head-tail connector protein [Aquibium microcysteis]
MALIRTVPPGAEPLTLADCKAHLRLAADDEDELLAGLIRAAREEVETQTGVAMIDQDWRLVLDAWPAGGIVPLTRHPVKQVLSVTLRGADGEATVMDPAGYRLDGLSRPARLWVETRPAPGAPLNGVEIDFRAGFGEAGPDVPDVLKRAMLLLVAHWYEFRAAWGTDDRPVSIPEGFRRLTDGWRRRRL